MRLFWAFSLSPLLYFPASSRLYGQEWRIMGGYNFLMANSWNNALSTYYYARPFLKGRESYLQSGISLSVGKIFSSFKATAHGIFMDYSNAICFYKDLPFKLSITYHELIIMYRLHLSKADMKKGVYGTFGAGPTFAGLFRASRAGLDPVYHSRQFEPGGGVRFGLEAGWRHPAFRHKLNLGLYCRPGVSVLHIPHAESVFTQIRSDYVPVFYFLPSANAGLVIAF